MIFKFDDNRPIYVQLVEQLKIMIVTKEYLPNDKLPSVREFAVQTKVNPNTVQRALSELENIGLITTKRTLGKFITNNKKVIEKVKKELAREAMQKFLKDIDNLNISNDEIIKFINENRKGKQI